MADVGGDQPTCALQLDRAGEPPPPAVDAHCADGGDDLSLEEILTLYGQPINEEQAWAVCYQCCRFLAEEQRRRSPVVSAALDIPCLPPPPQVIESLGIMVYKALDYGLKENEERELSPPLERLIDSMTNIAEGEGDACPDEGYEAAEEDESEEDLTGVSSVRGFRDVLKLCTAHLPSPSDAPSHYQAVCRALYAETMELRTFLEKIRSAKENLRKMEAERAEEPVRDLNELQNADWARFWVQVMRDLRHGVKLKKVQERQYNPLPIEFQLTPYEMLMDDIRCKRYKLRKVMVNGDIPPRLKKSAHEVILEFIRSRPPLNPVAARKLKPHPPRPRSLHERILEEIKAERKLRPVSPDEIRRSRLDAYTPETCRKTAASTLALTNGTLSARSQPNGLDQAQALSQRRKVLKAPTLAELDTSDSEEITGRKSASSSSISTSLMDDTSPESAVGKKTPPMFLPISSTPQPERRQAQQRRHSIEKETPTNVRQFIPPSRQSSKSLEEFCYPVECLALTVEEVMHIRQVLVKAELEKYQQYRDVYNSLKKGKLCFSCRTKRFSFFTWSYTCQFCKRPVCSQCCKKMRLPSKPYASLPIYSLGPSTTLVSVSNPSRLSRHGSRSSRDELELPKELTEDWSTMEVCVDCKKFISEIISSSKHSLSLATKRTRLKRKTHSLYVSSPRALDYRPSERTISEV
uniref:Spire-type actin nucleation factor 1a n=1 Tax=Scleropages formosus TaxID=113540 RepID=A0A8C9QZL5_SCLFO